MEEYFLQEDSGNIQQSGVRRKKSRQDSNNYKLEGDEFKEAKNDKQFSKPAKSVAAFQKAVRRVVLIYR